MFMFLFSFDDFFLELDELALLIGFAQLRTFFKVLPPLFCRFFSGYFWPSGASSPSSSSGRVGSPCRVFPAFSPWFSGGGGCDLCFFALLSCVLHLLCRDRLGQPGVRARKPSGPHRACTLLVPPDPSPAGSRRGVCDPAQLLGTMIVDVFCLPRGSPHPPNGPRPFRQCRGSLGGCFATLQFKLGPPMLGCSFFSALRVLHLFLS